MKKKNIDSKLSLPTKEEIKQTGKMAKDKFGIKVPKADLLRLIKLMKELNHLLEITPKDTNNPVHISEEMALECKEIFEKNYHKKMSITEAYNCARGMILLVPLKEKQRISDEMRAILVRHREVKSDSILLEKIAKLFKLHYKLDLTKDQLNHVLHIVTKSVWYEEGLNDTVDKFIDDMMIYVDKRQRGKKVNTLNLHNEVRQTLDWTVKELKLSKQKFDPLYRDEH